jgi:serine/threonine protein kinase
MEGFLDKEGAGVVKVYKKRYFILKNGELQYFKSKKENECLGTIPLKDTNVNQDSSQANGFSIYGPSLPRAYNLAAPSGEDKTKWIAAINQAIKQLSAGGAEEEEQIFADNKEDAKKVSLKDFEFLKDLGSGQYGKVKKVQLRGTDKVYAMKVMKKEQILKEGMIESCKAEKYIMQTIDHPYIVKLHYAFQTKDKLYLVMDLLSGGELFEHLSNAGRFPEDRCRLYGAEVASALDHVHKHNIIYRDLKPENLVLDAQGHVVLTDFGLAKMNMQANGQTYTFCGTPEYVAPEILQGTGHNKAVDWWSLGILLYEMLTGLPPFYSTNVNEMYEFILTKPLTFPDYIGGDAKDLVTKLLQRDPKKRLCNGDEVRKHAFFTPIDWDKLARREIPAPWVPQQHS